MLLIDCRGIDFGELLSPEVRAQHKHTAYDLIANIVHDGDPGSGKGSYRSHILHKVTEAGGRRFAVAAIKLMIKHDVFEALFLCICIKCQVHHHDCVFVLLGLGQRKMV